MTEHQELMELVRKTVDTSKYADEHWEGSFQDYLGLLEENPLICRTSYQRVYDMVLSYGVTESEERREKTVHYNFFDDPMEEGRDGLFGLDKSIAKFMNVIKAAAHHFGPERRILMLHGPVGSSKSTIVRLLKKGLEEYSAKPEGALYTFDWIIEDQVQSSMMNEEPLLLVPPEAREKLLDRLNDKLRASYRLKLDFDLSPISRYWYKELMHKYRGDWEKVMQHVRVRRLLISEKDRVGIGTFQPKDEKNQDSTELTGDLNYRKIAEFGTDSDPRAFNFDGEFCVANRGIIEFIEVLKLDVAFLYDLLSASQEHKIKPKKFAQTDIDEVIIGHTNEPEYRKLQSNELMEAFRDRTIKIDIPYNLKLS
ncbi:MAG TPA: serine protein kinase, partial [Planctomycetes bacterium]|nr:serine protein kinase [Planctomycetota bacterium]